MTRKLFVSDQLLETVLDNIDKFAGQPEKTRDVKRLCKRFQHLLESWFDGTTGPQDIESLKHYQKRVKNAAKSASPDYRGFYEGMLRQIEDIMKG